MLSYDNCPEKLPQMPDWPTIDGRAMRGWQPYDIETGIEITPLSDLIDIANAFSISYKQAQRIAAAHEALPTLVSIGLLDALLEVERVLAWNQTEKHPGAKWKSKSIDWHDSKAVSHLSKAQNESLKDDETGCSHRAHAACRLLMSLAHELQKQ